MDRPLRKGARPKEKASNDSNPAAKGTTGPVLKPKDSKINS